MSMNRRKFLQTGLLGGVALSITAVGAKGTFWGKGSQLAKRDGVAFQFLTEKDCEVLEALVPVMLGSALTKSANPKESLMLTIKDFDTAVSAFLPQVQKEVRELFTVLTFTPTRKLLAGVWSPWKDASHQTLDGFWNRWDQSKIKLLKSGRDGLVQLTVASFYGARRNWESIGYPGPPQIG